MQNQTSYTSYRDVDAGDGYPKPPPRDVLVPLLKGAGWWKQVQQRRAELIAGGMAKGEAHIETTIEFWRRYCDEKRGDTMIDEAIQDERQSVAPEPSGSEDMAAWRALQAAVDARKPERAEWGDVLNWVAERVLVSPDTIDPDSVPDSRSVGLLCQAQADPKWFWTTKNTYEAKTRRSDATDDEADLRRRDEREMADIIRDVERALAADESGSRHAAEYTLSH